MRRIIIVTIFLSCFLNIKGQQVDSKTAKTYATNFIINKYSVLHDEFKQKYDISDFSLELKEEKLNSEGELLYYVFHNIGNNGFVIVSGNYKLKPVIAYSLEGSFNKDSLPKSEAFWISRLEKEIEYILHQPAYDKHINTEWNNTKSGSVIVDPLLYNIKWGQFQPYSQIVEVNTGYTGIATGCVATAMAQVMKYYNYPLKGNGSHSYNEGGVEPQVGLLQSDFSQHEYNWHEFEDDYSDGYAFEIELGEMFFDIGVSVEMDYGLESAAYLFSFTNKDAKGALVDHFSFSNEIDKYSKLTHSEENWIGTLKNELDNKRPVLYKAADNNSDGSHVFICDGYTDEDYFHFNWGWDGSYSSLAHWYVLSVLNPASYDFSLKYEDVILINVKPDFEDPLEDKYENDNSFDNSRKIENNSNQLHSISSATDKDYYTFTLTATSDVTIETKGVNGNTQIWLYDNTRTYVDYDDDSGEGDNAKLNKRLSSGIYYFMIDEKGNDKAVPSYIITYNALSNEPQLSNSEVYPVTGNEETDFKFSIHYSDADGDLPLSGEAKLYIYGNENKILQMSLESGEAHNGVYSCTTKLPIGNYTYFISFINNSNQEVFTDFQERPTVHNSENMTIIPVLSCGIEETYEIELRYKVNDGSYVYVLLDIGKNPGFEVPPGGSVSLSLSTEGNYTFNQYELVQDDEVVWSYGHSGTVINFTDYASGIFDLNIDLDYTPQDFVVSGVIVNEDNTPYTDQVNIAIKSSQQSLSNSFSAGSFDFSNVDGGVLIEIIASGAPNGYQINPESYTIKNLDDNETDFKFQISSNDQLAPVTSLLQKPEAQAETNDVLFTWVGEDDVSDETNLLYQYKLDGFDFAYSDWTNNKSVSYNLPNGIYAFLVNCKDEAGNYRTDPLTYKFIVNANPQIITISKYDKGVWATKVTLKNTVTKNMIKQVVLLPEHSLTNFENIVPVRLYNIDDYSLNGGLDKLANTLFTDTVFISQNDGFVFNIPNEFPVSDTLEYIIEWGVHSKFGWQGTQFTESAFPSLVNNPPYDLDLEDRYLDDEGSVWRVATYKKKILTDDKYIYNAWAYIDKANSDEILINENEIENLQGSWESGVRYTRPECSDASIFKLGNNIAVVIREEKYERTYPSGDYLDSNYDRYIVKILNSSGGVIKSIAGEWQIDYTCYVAKDQINNQIWIEKRYFNDIQKGLCFTIIDENGNLIKENYEYYTTERTHSLYNGGCYPIGSNNTLILFEDSWETADNDDRANICFQIRNANGDLVKGTTVLNPTLMGDNFDQRDEYQIDDVITDNLGRVWITYDHDLGSEASVHYVVLDGSGNIIHGPVQVASDVDFYVCDKDNYVWLQWGSYIYLYDSELNEYKFNLQGVTVPSQNTVDKVAYVRYDHYNIFDRWSSQLISVTMNETNLSGEIEIFNDPINNEVGVKSLEVDVNDTDVYSSSELMQDSISIDLNDEFTFGNNLISINQNSLLGGNIIVTLPIIFNKEPQLLIPFSDISLDEDFGDTILVQSLNESFTDEQELSYQLEFNNTIVQAEIVESKISLTSINNQYGNFDFIVKASDGEFSVSDTFKITVSSINDSPFINEQVFEIDENSLNEILIGSIVASDIDNDNIAFSIKSGNINNTFSLESFSGDLYINDSTELDYEKQQFIDLVIQVQDDGEGYLSDEATVKININDIYEKPNGVNEFSFNDIQVKLFPIPVKDFLTIKISKKDKDKITVKLLDLNGITLYNFEYLSNSKTIDCRKLSSGVYLLKIIKNKEIKTVKFIKE